MRRTPQDLIQAIYPLEPGERLNPPTIADLFVLRAALKTLTPREEEVLQWYYFAGYTLDQIGQKYTAYPNERLTTERIRQIKDKALRKLRHPHRRGFILPAIINKAPATGATGLPLSSEEIQ